MTDSDFSAPRWLPARRVRVWALLDAPVGWPAWWPGLRRVAPCPADARECWRFAWRGALPYTLQADITIVEPEAPHALAVLAIGYTVPPLKLVYRTLGELDVAFTHSAGVLISGYLLQGGALGDPAPWLLSLPLMLAVLPAITLSHIPDSPADGAAGKRTIAVRFGARRAQGFALVAAALAAVLGVAGWLAGVAQQAFGPWMLGAAAHGGWLAAEIWRHRASTQPVGRIDRLLVIALSFILWFGLVPLLRLW